MSVKEAVAKLVGLGFRVFNEGVLDNQRYTTLELYTNRVSEWTMSIPAVLSDVHYSTDIDRPDSVGHRLSTIRVTVWH